MADSSSISGNSPTEKLGLGLLIPDTAPYDPITSDHHDVDVQPSESSKISPDGDNGTQPYDAVSVVEIIDADEAELRDAIEKQVCQLMVEQAEIEGGLQESLVLCDGEGEDLKIEKMECFDEEKSEKNVESFEGETEDEEGDDESEGNGDEHLLSAAVVKDGRYNNNQSGNRRIVTYPVRPDADHCAYYMKFGSCKFGSHCKFNHPPRRRNQGVKERVKTREEILNREGQTECKYYLTTGGCKYGKDCRYFHGSDTTAMSPMTEFNFLGLPIRPGEKECPYYLRTGSCKYGSTCKFHHPEPTTVTVGDSSSGFGNGGSHPPQLISSPSVSSWSSPRTYNESSPFLPVIYPPTQGSPTQNSEWNGYQASAYPTSERSLPTPPAFVINNQPSEINFPMQWQHDLAVEEYPERPGEPECSFFLRTGDCKYKSSCKYHHPKNRFSKAKANSYVLNEKGLPLRPEQPVCMHYHRYGICKYGPACKYDHPLNFGIPQPPFELKPFSDLRNLDGAGNFR